MTKFLEIALDTAREASKIQKKALDFIPLLKSIKQQQILLSLYPTYSIIYHLPFPNHNVPVN